MGGGRGEGEVVTQVEEDSRDDCYRYVGEQRYDQRRGEDCCVDSKAGHSRLDHFLRQLQHSSIRPLPFGEDAHRPNMIKRLHSSRAHPRQAAERGEARQESQGAQIEVVGRALPQLVHGRVDSPHLHRVHIQLYMYLVIREEPIQAPRYS